MSNALETFSLVTLNCRGLRDKTKRLALFNWLKTKYKGLVLLQEIHSTNCMKISGKTNGVTKLFFHMGSRIAGVLQY